MNAVQAPSGFKERNWRRLMNEMEKGNVIPVIGPELLMINYEGTLQPFYAVIARLLADRLDVETTATDPAEVIYAFSTSSKSDMTEPYYEIRDILRECTFEVPESLRLLAGIDAFNVFITTTFDDLLLRALNDIRFAGEARTEKLYYQRGTNRQDLTEKMMQPAGGPTVVYHIFGEAQSQPYVVTEDDLLEFGHYWQDEDGRPKKISSVLKEKYILILGCNFQNWLSRFFLYTFKLDSLFKSSEKLSLIADGKSRKDGELVLFLSRCQTHLYPDEVTEFVTELGQRWKAYSAANKKVVQERREEPDEYVKDAVFLSYASEDRAFVSALKERLEALGINVWFDRQELESGDLFQKKIMQNIEESSFFLPIISEHVLTNKRRFFRLEWTHAIEESRMRPNGIPFILPLAIDGTSEHEPFIPEEFRRIHWEKCPDGAVSDEFLEMIVGHIRTIRRHEMIK